MQKTNLLAAALVAVITLSFSGLSQAQTRADRYDQHLDRLERLTSSFEDLECIQPSSETKDECIAISDKMEHSLKRLNHFITKHSWAKERLKVRSIRLVELTDSLDETEKRLLTAIQGGKAGSKRVIRMTKRVENLRARIARMKEKVAKLLRLV